MKFLDEIAINGKRVFMRVDFNVPLTSQGQVANDLRMRFVLPSIKYVLERGGKLVLASHLGRPKGKVDPQLSLKPVAQRLAELLGKEVLMAPAGISPPVTSMVSSLLPGQLLLLENVRFCPEETTNDLAFSKALAELAEIYINDAFSTTHRMHASVVGITQFVPVVAGGLLLKQELSRLGELMTEPKKPYLAILGGAKVSDKLAVIERLMDKVDTLAIAGGMAYTFLKSQGIKVGRSLVEEELVPVAAMIMAKDKERGIKTLLPMDHVVAKWEQGKGPMPQGIWLEIPDDCMGLDVGPETLASLVPEVKKAKTIFWNGPLGLFEYKAFSSGTTTIAQEIAAASAVSIVGGGDTMAAVAELGLLEKMSHVSTGGGATLDFLAGKSLPGIEALKRRSA